MIKKQKNIRSAGIVLINDPGLTPFIAGFAIPQNMVKQKRRLHLKKEKSSLRLTHAYRSFNFLDPFSQLSIPGYLPPHSFHDTADRISVQRI
jgi:hypothetical protein